jgi:translation initiation factor 3 subunit L
MAYQRGRYEEEDDGPSYGSSASYGAVPDIVQSFVVYLYRHIREKNVYEIHQMYEGSFNKITERMFKQSPWPVVEAIAPFVENDHVFCLLYKELYFRHVFARLTPTLEQRMESWDNYCTLFQVSFTLL